MKYCENVYSVRLCILYSHMHVIICIGMLNKYCMLNSNEDYFEVSGLFVSIIIEFFDCQVSSTSVSVPGSFQVCIHNHPTEHTLQNPYHTLFPILGSQARLKIFHSHQC